MHVVPTLHALGSKSFYITKCIKSCNGTICVNTLNSYTLVLGVYYKATIKLWKSYASTSFQHIVKSTHIRTCTYITYTYINIYHLELGWYSQYSDHATNCEKRGSKCGRGRRSLPRTCSPAPASYSKGIGVSSPRIKWLRRETASYHDPKQLWNPNCIINLKIVLCLTKQYGLISQELYLSE